MCSANPIVPPAPASAKKLNKRQRILQLKDLVASQANDGVLWARLGGYAPSEAEAHLRKELKRLHEAVKDL